MEQQASPIPGRTTTIWQQLLAANTRTEAGDAGDWRSKRALDMTAGLASCSTSGRGDDPADTRKVRAGVLLVHAAQRRRRACTCQVFLRNPVL